MSVVPALARREQRLRPSALSAASIPALRLKVAQWPMKAPKLIPGLAEAAKGLWLIYAAITWSVSWSGAIHSHPSAGGIGLDRGLGYKPKTKLATIG